MSARRALAKAATTLGLIGALSACAGAAAFAAGQKRWSEAVLLHDGRQIVVERVQNLGGRPTLDARERQMLDETITFTIPDTRRTITWAMSFRDDIPEANGINVVALGIVDDVAYIAGYPAGCIAYNKWQRPNPPQILFKYQGDRWQRVTVVEFPPQVSRANLIVGGPPAEGIQAFYTVEQVNEENRDIDTPEYKSVVREPVARERCPQYSSSPKSPIPLRPSEPAK